MEGLDAAPGIPRGGSSRVVEAEVVDDMGRGLGVVENHVGPDSIPEIELDPLRTRAGVDRLSEIRRNTTLALAMAGRKSMIPHLEVDMQLTKTSEYAIRTMVYLATQNGKHLSVMRLHQQLHIPYKYLGKMMRRMARGGLVKSFRGKNGGYQVRGGLDEITLARIVDVVEGLDSYERCILGFETCGDENPCPMHKLWGPQREALKAMIFDTTLHDLVEQEGISF